MWPLVQAPGFRLQASGFRLQASGMSLFCIRANLDRQRSVIWFNPAAVVKWLDTLTSRSYRACMYVCIYSLTALSWGLCEIIVSAIRMYVCIYSVSACVYVCECKYTCMCELCDDLSKWHARMHAISDLISIIFWCVCVCVCVSVCVCRIRIVMYISISFIIFSPILFSFWHVKQIQIYIE